MEKNNSQSNSYKARDFLKVFLKPYKLQIIAALVALCITAMVTLGIGQAIKWLIDAGFGTAPSIKQLNTAIGMFLGLIILLALGTYARFYFVSWLGERVSADISKQLFGRVLQFNPTFFETHGSGEIQSRILNDTTVLQTVIGSSLSLALRNLLLFVGGVVLLIISNLKLTLLVSSLIPIVVLPILFFGRKVRQLSREGQAKIADVGSYLNETLNNIKTVHAYNHQSLDIQRFSNLVETAFATAKLRIKKRALLTTLVIVLIFGGITGLIWIGAQDVARGEITSGNLAAFIFYAVVVAGSLGALSEVYGDLQRAAGAVERLMQIWITNDSILLNSPVEKTAAPNLSASLTLENIDFSYPSHPNKLVLQDLNLKVNSGEKVAIVGPTGAGKTTIFELLLRFYEPQSGKISIDGINIGELHPEILRGYFALVSQEPQLFTGTVRENIAYGLPEATELQIEEAAKNAYAHEFIMELPQGYATDLGNRGIRLSGGQRQRIVIARALLKNPKILLLDEATSSLDARSEQQVHQALEKLMIGRTTLVIAHRLSTVVNADRIVVLEKGKIIAIGTHNQLLLHCPLYTNLATLQFAKLESVNNSLVELSPYFRPD